MIRTVLGDIDKNQSGNILMHEHIQCVSNDMLRAFGNRWLDEKELENHAVQVLKAIREQYGIGTFVDGTAIDLGRNISLLERVAKRSGVNIVASTGLYYYPSMITCMRSVDELSQWFVYECMNGIEGTEIKPGIIKCAADSDGMTADTVKRLTALAITQSKTGLPMYAHCSHTDNLAYEMMNLFAKYNVNPKKTVIGHCSRRLDVKYLTDILREGYYICIDQSWAGDEDIVAETVYELSRRGFDRQILFSQDKPLYNDFETGDRIRIADCETEPIDRYSFTATKIIPALKLTGCTESQCDMFLYGNAQAVLDI